MAKKSAESMNGTDCQGPKTRYIIDCNTNCQKEFNILRNFGEGGCS